MPILNPDVKKTVSFTLPDEALTNDDGIFNAFAVAYGYQSQLPSDDTSDPSYVEVNGQGFVNNPVSKQDHFLGKVIEYVESIWEAYNKKKIAESAIEAAASELATTKSVARSNTNAAIS